ncbi:MAG: DUF4437 domain-containing protein [Sphaerospermopsis sp. SIO1G2]|nr:DUF4437 domain-containing protein [Sphaerospermopsis sp. SIO1G2]
MRKFLALLLVSFVIAACTSSQITSDNVSSKPETDSNFEVVLMSEVKWQQLNPARGDKSPQAGTLWGDRTGLGAAGFLLKPVDGFRSPPHIHNVAYRGVVISGDIHNDDPDAEDMWMPQGSFWTQPAGGVHITAAKGSDIFAYIEVEDKFGVLPAEQAFSSPERPINVDVSNIIWIDNIGMPSVSNGAKVAFLWGKPRDNNLYGTFIKLPAGFSGKIRSQGSTFRAVVIKGQPQYQASSDVNAKDLEPGSYFSSTGNSVHQVSSQAGEESIIYIRTDGKYEVT